MLTQGHALLSYLALRPTFTTTFWLAPLLGGIFADLPWISFCCYHWWAQTDADNILSSYYQDQWQMVWGYSHSFVLSSLLIVITAALYCVSWRMHQSREAKLRDRELFRDPIPCNSEDFDMDMVVLETDRKGRPVSRLNFDDNADDEASESTGIFTDNGKTQWQREKANGRRSHHSSLSRPSPVHTPPLSSSSFASDASVPLHEQIQAVEADEEAATLSYDPSLMRNYVATRPAPFRNWGHPLDGSSFPHLRKPRGSSHYFTDPMWGTEWVFWFSVAWFLHCFGDFPVHCDDAHSQFLPFTKWKWHSPISWWNVRHYAVAFAPFETALVLISCVWCYRRSSKSFMRASIILVVLSYVVHLLWTITDYTFWMIDYANVE